MKKIYFCCLLLCHFIANAQTEIDGIMMSKNQLCTGAIFQYGAWSNYWEGTFKRDNQNLGTVSNNNISINGNYGVTDKLNVIVSLPYIATKASAGTLKGQSGLQDLSATIKYMPIEKTIGKGIYSVYTIAGISIPTTNYVADYLPLSIGLQSRTATFRLMGDYQRGNFFTTVSAAYQKRAAITIDRNAYFTTEMVYSNEVAMPDVININLRTGYRSGRLIAEAILDNQVTQGGFDITKNNMPFPSNTMNALRIGMHTKYTFPSKEALSLVGGFNHVLDGRNVGQTNAIYAGFFYIINFNKKTQ
jgi:hypothetical protein